MTQEALKLALKALHKGKVACELGQAHDHVQQIVQAMKAIKEALAQPEQEPVAWMGTDVDGNPNKFRLNFFSGAIPLFTTLEDRSLIANNEKNGSPCPEFWDWLPKAYNFDGDGAFTKYNMEVAFLAGKQYVATNNTSSERVDEMQKQRHDTTPPQRTWVGLTDEEVDECYYWKDCQWTTDELVRHVEAKLKEKNT